MMESVITVIFLPRMIQVDELASSLPTVKSATFGPFRFHVQAGEVFGLFGTEASGRVALQRIFMGLERRYSGTVHFQGKELQEWSRDFYEQIGCYLSGQPFAPFNQLTAEENVTYCAKLYRGETLASSVVLESVGLQKAAQLRVSEFTPGMLARLGLARAILNKPAALFLDEPLRDVEPEFQDSILSWIRQQKKRGCVLVLGLRDPALVQELCDRHISLSPESASDREKTEQGA
jgi:fluoroquinolone transport system ATP-binding protein